MFYIRVTIVKDKKNRKSKGVAFVLFLHRDEATVCVKATNGIQVMKNDNNKNIL